MTRERCSRYARCVFALGRIGNAVTVFQDWSRAQVVLLLGPLVVSVVLAVFYVSGMLPFEWPGLLLAIAVVNLAGDLAYALRDEHNVRQGKIELRNAIVGQRAVAEQSFVVEGRSYSGRVTLAGESWEARSVEPVEAGTPVQVAGRHGLVLQVTPASD